jgi:hypothetical protein
MMKPIIDKPFYAVELSPSMRNTQGGPRARDAIRRVRLCALMARSSHRPGGATHRAPRIWLRRATSLAAGRSVGRAEC